MNWCKVKADLKLLSAFHFWKEEENIRRYFQVYCLLGKIILNSFTQKN